MTCARSCTLQAPHWEWPEAKRKFHGPGFGRAATLRPETPECWLIAQGASPETPGNPSQPKSATTVNLFTWSHHVGSLHFLSPSQRMGFISEVNTPTSQETLLHKQKQSRADWRAFGQFNAEKYVSLAYSTFDYPFQSGWCYMWKHIPGHSMAALFFGECPKRSGILWNNFNMSIFLVLIRDDCEGEKIGDNIPR